MLMNATRKIDGPVKLNPIWSFEEFEVRCELDLLGIEVEGDLPLDQCKERLAAASGERDRKEAELEAETAEAHAKACGIRATPFTGSTCSTLRRSTFHGWRNTV